MRIAAKWGLVLGLAIGVWTLALHGLGYYTTRVGAGQIADILATGLPIAAIVLALRERASAAPLSLSGATATAVAVGFVSLVVTIPFFWWYHHVVNPQWADYLVTHTQHRMAAAGRTPASIDSAVAAVRASATDRAQIVGAIMGTVLVSTVIGLVTGAVLRIRSRRVIDRAPRRAPHPGMYALAAIACEAIPIALLVTLVFLNGVAGSTEPPEAFAQRTALWFGPIASMLTTLAVSWMLHRGRSGTTRHGFWFGCAVGALDLGIVASVGGPFLPIVVISAISKAAAGAFGAFLASGTHRRSVA